MANHLRYPLPIVIEYEFSRLASQYLIEAYAQVLPEIRAQIKPPQPNESKLSSVKEAEA